MWLFNMFKFCDCDAIFDKKLDTESEYEMCMYMYFVDIDLYADLVTGPGFQKRSPDSAKHTHGYIFLCK